MTGAEVVILQAKYILLAVVSVAAALYVVALWVTTLDTSPPCRVCGERYGKFPNENILHDWWPMGAGTNGIHRYEPDPNWSPRWWE